MQHLRLIVNGFSRELLVQTHETLLDTLRDRLSLTGTKKCCDQGSCGACTVHVNGKPILSCLTPAARCEGKQIRTIEGIAQNGTLHPLQKHMVEMGAIQCGYCTPGMVMTGVAFLERVKNPTKQQIREALAGNLCRCTGYQTIVDAMMAAAEDMRR